MSFAQDTALTVRGAGRYTATITPEWNVVRGPFGGFVAALLMRAIAQDSQWPPRTLAIHFLDAPRPGEVEIAVSPERAGRSSAAHSLRLTQDGVPMALALATVGARRPDQPDWVHVSPPQVPPPEDCPEVRATDRIPPFMHKLEIRWGDGGSPILPGPPYNVAWVSTGEPLDDVALAALADVWMPPAFGQLGRPVVVPTIDLTIHFRAAPADGSRWVLAAHRTDHGGGGTWTSDGELWSEDGTLLVQARQLALLRA